MVKTIEDIEKSIEWDKQLSNSIKVDKGDLTIIYSAKVEHLAISGENVTGKLSFYKENEKTVIKRNKLILKRKIVTKKKYLWGAYHTDLPLRLSEIYFIKNGNLVQDLSRNSARGVIFGTTYYQKIVITKNAVEELLAPIEKRIMEQYKAVMEMYEK